MRLRRQRTMHPREPRTWLRHVLLGAAVIAACLVSAASADDILRIHLIWTNDIHGHVAPEGANFMNPNFPPPLGGGASAAAYVQLVREACRSSSDEAVLLVDAGDTWQGAPEGTLTEGEVVEEYFNALEYDVVVPGNHEFDKGKELAVRMSANMRQKFVCANIYVAGTETLVDWVEPYRIFERAGLRIGVIGANTPGTAQMAFDEHIAGLDFGPIVPAVEKWRDHLYDVENVDVVFLVVHEGLPFDPDQTWKGLQARVAAGENIRDDIRGAMDLAHVLERVPVIVAGHTHRGYRDPWIDPVTHTMVLETFGNGSSLGHVILEFDRATKQIVGFDKPRRDGVLVTLFEDEWWPEGEVAERLRPYFERVRAGLDVKVGASRVELTRRGGSNSPMGNFVTECMRAAQKGEFAFTNTGGLRTDLSMGDITVGDLMRVEPFGNELVVVDMSGRDILRIFERKSSRGSSGIAFSGAKVVVDPDAAFGNRVLELTVAGQPLDLNRTYRVVTTDYLMEGNSGLDFLAQIDPDTVGYTMQLARAAMTLYLEANSPVRPVVDDRWREKPGGTRAAYLASASVP